MHVEKKRVNVYKWLVFVWAGHKAIKALKMGHAMIKARRLKKKSINQKIVDQYSDL